MENKSVPIEGSGKMSQRVLVLSHMYPNPVNPMAGIFVHNQSKALQQAGTEVRVVAPMPDFPLYPKWAGYREMEKETVMDGIPVRYVPTFMFPGGLFFSRYGSWYIQSLKKVLYDIKKETPYDLIHCHTIFPDGYAGAFLKEEFGVPVVSTIHGSDIMLYPKRSQAIYDRTLEALERNDHVITVSERLRQEALNMHPGLSATTIYNGFDPERFAPMDKGEARRALGLSEEGQLLLFIGNLLPVKGVHFLLKAFAEVAKEAKDLNLILIGDGPLKENLRNQASELNIQDRVSFLGRKPYSEIPRWIAARDVVTLTSKSEGLPSVLLETMGCGRAMVATDVGGIKEILKDGETGLLAEPENPSHIAACYRKLFVENPAMIQEMGDRAFVASRELTWERNAQKVQECYQQVAVQRASL